MEIKKCPCCGGKPKVISKQKNFLGWRGNGTRAIEYCIYVKCNRCHSRGKPIKTKAFDSILEKNRRDFKSEVLPYVERAVEAWNRRVDDGREEIY